MRHGETDANREGVIQGQLDTQLNEAGVAQAKMTAKALADVQFSVAYSSDLNRAAKVSKDVIGAGQGSQRMAYV